METNLREIFLRLVRLGIGLADSAEITEISGLRGGEWRRLKALADAQGLTAVVLDGLNGLTGPRCTNGTGLTNTMPVQLKLEWIGEVLQGYEARFKAYEKAIGSLAKFYQEHGIKMMVLKGYACGINWPKPEHRPCGDIDIWLFGRQKAADAALRQAQGPSFKIDTSHHHHTVFDWEGFMVENHYDFVNVHAHRSSMEIERIFKELGDEANVDDDDNYNDDGSLRSKLNKNSSRIRELENDSNIYLPSANLHALFLIKHMVSHFAAANITLRQVMDWAFFVKAHTDEIGWEWLKEELEHFHMTDFFNCLNGICVGDLGFSSDIFERGVQFDPAMKERVLNDILAPKYTAAEPKGFFKRMVYKYQRWQGNAWKQRLCYKESRTEIFFRGLWAHALKP